MLKELLQNLNFAFDDEISLFFRDQMAVWHVFMAATRFYMPLRIYIHASQKTSNLGHFFEYCCERAVLSVRLEVAYYSCCVGWEFCNSLLSQVHHPFGPLVNYQSLREYRSSHLR